MIKRNAFLVFAVLLFAPLLCAQAETATESEEGLSDREVGLAKGSIFEVLVPEAAEENSSDPGESPLLPRAFEGAPPAVNHLMSDYLPITLEDNLCVDCHQLEEAEEGDPTPIPESHFIDYRTRPEEVGQAVAGARYICVSCHVVLTDAKPLVANPPPAE